MATGQLIIGSDTVNDSLTGTTGDDTLRGLGGNDVLNGGAGADSLEGGTGDDVYVVDQAGDKVVEAAASGTDRVESSVAWTLGANVEDLTLTGSAAVSGTGNELGNNLFGNTGNNRLEGGAGDDYLDGGTGGDDTLAGGLGDDVYNVNSAGDLVQEAASEGADTVYILGGLNSYTLGANVENLNTLGSTSFKLGGNALGNTITASTGADTVAGHGGEDFLNGGSGADLLFGDDVIAVRARADLLGGIGATMEVRVEGVLIGTVQVTSTTFTDYWFPAVLPAGAATKVTVTFTNDAGDGNGGDRNLFVESVSVNGVTKASSTATYDRGAYDGLDTLPGAAGTMAWNGTLVFGFATEATVGAGDVLSGGSGADTMIGGLGDDTYFVENAGDLVVENAGEGWDSVSTSINDYTLGTNLESLTLGQGTAAVRGTGNALDNELIGNAAANTLTGLAGNDYFEGGAGDDTLVGGLGDDTFGVYDSGDVVQEAAGEGNDLIYLVGASTYAMGANVETLATIGTANGGGGYYVTGSDENNRINASAAADVLVGKGGSDTLSGGSGNDRLIGDDLLVVRARSDLFQGLGGLMEVKVEGVTVGQVYVNNTTFADYYFSVTLPAGAATKVTVAFLNDGGAQNVGDRNLFVESVSLNGTTKLASTSVYDRYELDGIDTLPGATGAMPWNGTLIFTYATTATVGGDDLLTGGTGADTMAGGKGNDTYSVDNVDDVIAELAGDGTDLVNSSVSYALSDNVENLTLAGTAAINGSGNALGNALKGNTGNNRLDGGAGADTLTGGLGDDTYVVDSASDSIVELAGEGNDTVETSLTYTLGDTLENLRLVGSGWINGTGNGGNNLIEGNAGNNVLDGGSGADILRGGEGDDTYVIDSQYDVIQEVADIDASGDVRFGGTDTVKVGFDYTLDTLLENLELTGGTAVYGNGNASDNVLIGNGADNVLTGAGGFDYLDGGAGADTMAGGLDGDTYVVDNANDSILENANGGIDTVLSSATFTLANNLEYLQLTGGGAANGTGNALANLLYGNDAVNTLTGLGGDDTLQGGLGADTLVGGAGNDLYIVQGASQVVTELDAEGTDTVRVQGLQNYTLGTNVEIGWISSAGLTGTLSLSGNASANTLNGSFGNDMLFGGASNDTLLGGYGNDTLDGGIGADSLAGGLGDDTYIVDDAGDRIAEADRQGADTVWSTLTYTLAGTFLENLLLTGTSAINATGSAGNNQLTGNGAANTLTGGAGNDTLNGGAGNDALVGGIGNDSYIVEGANDSITELLDEGIDLVTTGVTYTLGANLEQLTLSGTAAINGTGNALANLITGNSAGNTLDGGTGIDTLAGGAGGDVYYLDNASDVIVEKAGEGNDAAYLGFAGTYVFDAENGWVENVYVNGTYAVNVTGNAADNVFFGNAGADVLNGAGGNDLLLGGAGSDTLVAGTGYDYLSGSTGADTYIVDLALGGTTELAIGDTNLDVLDIRGVTDKSQLTFRRVLAQYATEESEYPDWVDGAGTTVEIGRAGGGGTVVVDLFKADGTNASRLSTIKVGTQVLTYDEIRTAVTYAATTGNDRLYGFSAADSLSGGEGNDSLEGAGGADTLVGGNGADSLRGGAGSDSLDGGTGNDTLYGSEGVDILAGGSGNDSYVLTGYANGIASSATIVDNDATAGNADSLSLDFNPYRALFQQAGNDLKISAIGTSNAIVVKDWFAGGTANHVENLSASGLDTANTALLRSGTLTDAKVQSLVTAMAGFSPTAGQSQFTDAATLAAINSAWTITTQAV